LRDLGALEWAEKARADGRIHHLGFSFHDTLDVFKEIIDAYDKWEVCQIQYNYMDVEFQAGLEGLRYASDRGLATIIMEPLRGGQLTKRPPETIAAMMKTAPVNRTPADMALQWVWNQPEVSVVLSGMTTMQHVTENIESADKAAVGSVSAAERQLIDEIRTEYLKTTPIPCTSCKYCMPCPEGVHIFQIFELYNDGHRYKDNIRPRMVYKRFLGGKQADACVECFECEEVCPQDIPIVEWLKTAHGWMLAEK
ncbi:MAG: aldo/keto reductase, partial [bacterium]